MRTHFAFDELHADHALATSLGLSLRGMARKIAHLGEVWHEIRERSEAMQELAALSDEELADIGVTRSMIPHLFDGDRRH